MEVIITYLIFADRNNKHMIQEILDWGLLPNITFQMTFTTDKNKMKQFLQYNKADMIVTCTKAAALFLSKRGLKFIYVENNWKKGIGR